MGTLLGHVLPGTLFLIAGVWWTYNIFKRYFVSLKRHQRFSSSVSFQLRQTSSIPWENIIALVAITGGIVGEIYTGIKGGKFVEMGNGQHATMYAFFGFHCLVDILRFYDLPLIPDIEYITGFMAFLAEGFLFAFHGHGDSHMEMLVHQLLLLAVLGSAVSTILELMYRENVLAALSRAFFALLQGTWFLQVGFILFPPAGWHGWDVNSSRQQKLATMVFMCHWLGVLVGMGLTGAVLRRQARLGRSHSPIRQPELTNLSDRRHRDDTEKLLHASEDEL